MKFLFLGWPGLKIVLITLPYDYIALFIITIVLANFIVHKFDLSRGISMNSNVAVAGLLAAVFLLSSFFAVGGVGNIVKDWSKNKVPTDVAISGKIIDYSNNQIIVREEDGSVITVILNNQTNEIFPRKPGYVKGKFLRAIGKRNENNTKFQAEEVECCDAN